MASDKKKESDQKWKIIDSPNISSFGPLYGLPSVSNDPFLQTRPFKYCGVP